jgi:Zn-dependent protease
VTVRGRSHVAGGIERIATRRPGLPGSGDLVPDDFMYTYDPTPTTPLDLNLSLFGFSIRVHPFFWLTMALLGWNPDDLQSTLIWTFAGFITILTHELAHALVGRWFGAYPYIVLTAFGGYAGNASASTPWRNIAVLVAGPGMNFLTGSLALAANIAHTAFAESLPFNERAHENIQYFLGCLIVQGFVWGCFNLLPVYPLDGGQILRNFLSRYRPRDGVIISLQVSMVIAVLVGALMLRGGVSIFGLMMLLMAFQNWQEYQATRSSRW